MKSEILEKPKICIEFDKGKTKAIHLNNKNRSDQSHNCDCGGSYTNVNKSKHMKTKKHRLFFLL